MASEGETYISLVRVSKVNQKIRTFDKVKLIFKNLKKDFKLTILCTSTPKPYLTALGKEKE